MLEAVLSAIFSVLGSSIRGSCDLLNAVPEENPLVPFSVVFANMREVLDSFIPFKLTVKTLLSDDLKAIRPAHQYPY